MPRGGYRPGAGRPRKVAVTATGEPVTAPVAISKRRGKKRTPLEYMVAVMNDPAADVARRDRMAIAAAPFLHGKATVEDEGKRVEAQRAAEKAATSGRFTPAAPPRLAVNNG